MYNWCIVCVEKVIVSPVKRQIISYIVYRIFLKARKEILYALLWEYRVR